MNVERMLELADRLETDERVIGHFDMENFWSGSETHVSQVLPILNVCGTAACAGGWACIFFGGPSTRVAYSDARDLLGLDEDEAQYLFYQDMQMNHMEVANKIRQMVRDYKGE